MVRAHRIGVWLIGLAIAGCSPSAELSSPLPDQPTIVSLNPCLDAILVDIAAPDQILALSHYSRDPNSSSIDAETAMQFGVTGGTAEEVIALGPDLVVASTFLSPSLRAAFESAGIAVETFASPTSLTASLDQISALANVAGHPGEGDRLRLEVEQATAPIAPVSEISTLLWQQGQIVPGEATLISELLGRNGFTNHAAARGLQQADYVSLETVLADPPELVLVAGDSIGQRHPVLSRLDRTQVQALDPKLFFCGGPSILAAQDRLREIRAELR